MRHFVAMICITLAVLVLAAGCADQLRWPPTEQQKQAADLAVQNLQALGGHVEPQAEGVRMQAVQAAKITQTYLGLPSTPIQSGASQAVLTRAQKDAARPPPTLAEAAEVSLGVADEYLRLAGAVAAALGLPAGVVLIKRARAKTAALSEITAAIDALPPDTKKVVKKGQKQSDATEALVGEVRRKARRKARLEARSST